MSKPVSLHARSIRRTFVVCVFAIVTSACGYKGPLYLPPPPDTLKGQNNSTDLTSAPRESSPTPNSVLAPSQTFLLEPTPELIE